MKECTLITGANRGLGLALARAARERGQRVIATCRQPGEAEALRSVPDLTIAKLDVASGASRAEFARLLSSEGVSLSLVIHNAGINSQSVGAGNAREHVVFGELTEEALLQTARTNAIGPLLLTQELQRLLAPGARVLAISSWFGSLAERDRGFNFSYSGSKALLNMYLRLAGLALREQGMIALTVNPGWMRTEMGGERAALEPAQSAAGILDLAARATPEMSGGFFDWNGTPHAW